MSRKARSPKLVLLSGGEKKSRKTSRLRPHETTAADAKTMILAAGNVLAGVFGFFENLEKGDLVGDAARKELGKIGRRARALEKAETEEAPEEDDDDGRET